MATRERQLDEALKEAEVSLAAQKQRLNEAELRATAETNRLRSVEAVRVRLPPCSVLAHTSMHACTHAAQALQTREADLAARELRLRDDEAAGERRRAAAEARAEHDAVALRKQLLDAADATVSMGGVWTACGCAHTAVDAPAGRKAGAVRPPGGDRKA